MVKAEWGQRFVCFKCNARFYDLQKPVPICPKCGADQTKAPVRHTSTPTRVRTRTLIPEEVVETEDRTGEGEFGGLSEIGLDEIDVEEPEEEL